MAVLGQFRGDTEDNWKKYNPILADREFILVKMSSQSPWSYFKIGNGVDEYSKLPLLTLIQVTPAIRLSKYKVLLNEANNYTDIVDVITNKNWEIY